MAIPSSFKDELVARSDIVDVVSDYVTLTPKGGAIGGSVPFMGRRPPPSMSCRTGSSTTASAAAKEAAWSPL